MHARVSKSGFGRVLQQWLKISCNVMMNIHVSLRQTVSTAEASRIRARVFQELGWDHLVEVDKKWAVLGHPPSFALF